MEEMFWDRVDKKSDYECWIWKGSLFLEKNGRLPYGRFVRDDVCYKAHRVSWEIHNHQKIPEGLFVCHKCDNPKCVNPSHLFIGTAKENAQDRDRKGRGLRGRNPHKSYRRGIAIPWAKLNDEKVREIRNERNRGVSLSVLSQRFGVSPQSIRDAAIGKKWGHVK